MNAQELAKAIKDITNTDIDKTGDSYVIVKSKEAAETISQIFLDAGNGGVITGPYLQPINKKPTRIWTIDK